MNINARVLDMIGQVVQIHGRAFPGLCFQGDTILYLYMSLFETYKKVQKLQSLSEDELLALEMQIEIIEERLIHYFNTCIEFGYNSSVLKQKFDEIRQGRQS